MNPSDLEARLQRLEARTMRKIWAGTDWFVASILAGEAGLPPRLLLIWEAERKLFSLNRPGAKVYPAYVFSEDFAPLPVISEVWSILTQDSPLGLACWFESTSGFLGGARPRELVSKHLVLAAARDRLEAEMYAS